MNSADLNRGRHFTHVTGLRAFTGGLFLRGFERIVDRIDHGLEFGTIEGILPDGSARLLGGRGAGPTAVVTLHSWKALLRLVRGGSVGWYEAWAAGEWSSPNPVQIFDLFMRNRLPLGTVARSSGIAKVAGLAMHSLRRNSRSGARRNIEFHYDLGNDFYRAWLDESMTYSSALFAEPMLADEALETAQQRKIQSLLKRLHLSDGDKLLEIGCGWGGLAEAALRANYIHYHGITLSPAQKAYADARLSGLGDAQVSLTDYRDVAGQYDAIASVEMVEAVGQQYWPAYLKSIARCLKPGGRAAIQYIRIEDDVFESYARGTDFIQHYIFPGGMLLSESRFRAIAGECGLSWENQYDFGLHYAETLRQWRVRFDAAVAGGTLPGGFDDKFISLWRYYLMYCEGGFRGGGINVAQVTLAKQ
ncbi:class I SAM-dependent methyltransferase [Sphingorhabdus sp.]|uniref:class I SAM-dependent methyltransferase n=1 Tax=Sphingorhabdus sp. TaxID=1902408 RepID=UPI003919B06B